MTRTQLCLTVSAVALAFGLANSSPAFAQASALSQTSADLPTPPPDAAHKPQPVRASFTVAAGTGRVLHLNDNAANVFTADPKVAEVRPASANSLFVFGVAPGSTTVAALTTAGDMVAQYQVTVVASGFTASQARSAISRVEHGGIRTRDTETGLSMSGSVATPEDAERAVDAARGVLPPDGTIDDRLSVKSSLQVGLHVRIAEMNRTLTRQLGVKWSLNPPAGLDKAVQFGVSTQNGIDVTNTNPSSFALTLGRDLTQTIDALSDDNLVHTLAEPNLTAMSGETASFLVGGEFPIPVASDLDRITIVFKQYGISLAFVPTVLSNGRISLHVRPEISALDYTNATTSSVGSGFSIKIPALIVRRADTTVELGSGQSFAIAGLLSDQTTQDGQGVPGLGDVPVLGALFRSDNFKRQQTELVIVVTPYIIRPVSDPNALRLPTDGYVAPTDIERILELRQLGKGSTMAHRRIPAGAGFMVE